MTGHTAFNLTLNLRLQVNIMIESIYIHKEDTNAEVVARIVKATSRKYDCSMEIDFQEGNRIAQFVGDENLRPAIAEDVQKIFTHRDAG